MVVAVNDNGVHTCRLLVRTFESPDHACLTGVADPQWSLHSNSLLSSNPTDKSQMTHAGKGFLGTALSGGSASPQDDAELRPVTLTAHWAFHIQHVRGSSMIQVPSCGAHSTQELRTWG